jgi:hypothetical protein
MRNQVDQKLFVTKVTYNYFNNMLKTHILP